MKAKQLSVFLENKSGRLTEVTEALGAAGINLSAMSIADDVIGFVCPNTSGSLAIVLKHLSDNGVFIEYMYSFANGDVATVVIRPTDLEACDKILAEKKVELMADSDLYQL